MPQASAKTKLTPIEDQRNLPLQSQQEQDREKTSDENGGLFYWS